MRKKEYIGCLLVLAIMYAWILPGCGRQSGVFYETTQDADSAAGTKRYAETGAGDMTENDMSVRNADVLSEGGAGADGAGAPSGNATGADGADAPSGNAAGADSAGAQSENAAGADAAGSVRQSCYIHICGAVLYPGVYEVPEGSRLYEVIVLAGGLCADACDYLVNQAQTVSDGMQIYIPTVAEAQLSADGTQRSIPTVREAQEGNAGAVSDLDTAFRTEEQPESRDTRIDLNRATAEQLMTLPGIGETRALAIVAYRETHGGFQTIEELMEVSGIKQGVYDRLKEMIKV